MVLPLIILPFAVLLFWLLGGGTSSQAIASGKTGLNTALPDANLKTQSSLDKLSFYVMADRDSLKRAEQVRMDPNYPSRPSENTLSSDGVGEILDRKVATLQRKVDQPEYYQRPMQEPVAESSTEIDRLQKMVQTISEKKTDPEIEALNGTLDKLLEMQNPGWVKKESPKETKRKWYAVSAEGTENDISYFGNGSGGNPNEFLSDSDELKDSLRSGTIMAVVHGEQILLAGSVVKLRLLQDVFINGERIPVGSFVFGNTSIDIERLKVVVSSIQFQNRLYPVSLRVFDMDGLEGIHIPGSVSREAVKQTADQGIQSVSGMSFDPSLKAQSAAAGVNAAKNLFSKKIKQERVTVKAGYRVLLKDESEKNY